MNTTKMKNSAPTTTRLRLSDRRALEEHFVALDGEDRRLRFGSNISDDGLRQYAARIDFAHDGIFAVHDDDLRLVAVIHVAFSGGTAELGLSVLPSHRGQGHGSALFARAMMHMGNRGTREVYVHCLSENAAMMHIARKNGMRIIPAGFETDARLAIPPSTPHTMFTEWIADHRASAVRTARRNALFTKSMLGMLPTAK
jgi:RimJ/RimL family protein N-acetyltransferase